MSAVGARAAALRDVASRCRATADVVDLAAQDAATAVTRTVGCVLWDGPAATAHAEATRRLADRARAAVLLIRRAADALEDVAASAARTSAVLREIGAEAASAAVRGDAVRAQVLEQQARAAQAEHRSAEQAAAVSLTAVASALPTDWGAARVLGLTHAQWRDALRGAGDVAWEAGPESVSFALRRLSVPGWLGGWNWLDRTENDAKAWLQDRGGGRADGAAYWGVYGSGTVAAAFLPGPFGKPGAADNAARIAAAGPGALRGGDEAVRSADEWRRLADRAGEWQGSDGLRLSARQNREVILFHADAAHAERSITPRLLEVSHRMGVPMAGLEHRLKTLDSLRRKVATGLVHSGADAPGELAELKDSVRYTFTSSDTSFVDDVTAVAGQLEASGFDRVRWHLSWPDDAYHGLNTAWLDPETGHVFEVQFHTPGSLWMKEQTHGLYEERRTLGLDEERVAALAREEAELYRQVTRPPGIDRLRVPPPP